MVPLICTIKTKQKSHEKCFAHKCVLDLLYFTQQYSVSLCSDAFAGLRTTFAQLQVTYPGDLGCPQTPGKKMK